MASLHPSQTFWLEKISPRKGFLEAISNLDDVVTFLFPEYIITSWNDFIVSETTCFLELYMYYVGKKLRIIADVDMKTF